ncbi:phosphatidate cytidylyltransferase [Bauldia sp.]|uniref:phosphatidate cytidylyltransferase n=1 Tax=Bauldia sp. TaxID=2575872 RepID=UPI003BA9E2B3
MAAWISALSSPLLAVIGAVWALLGLATLAVSVAAPRLASGGAELAARTRTWWWIVAPITVALLLGASAVAVLFALVSFVALREFLSIVPVRHVDRTAILLAYLAIPLQYWFVADDWYGMFAIFIPVYVAAIVAFRLVLSGETTGFIRSAGMLQWGLFLTVYNLSHVAFLMELDLAAPAPAGGAGLVLFILIVVGLNDVAQYVVGKLCGRHPIVPKVSPKKSIEGFLGGVTISALVAVLLLPWLTPFGPLEGAAVGALLAALGFVGDVTVSALKRDLGIKDSGGLLPGHGGVLDRLDSLLFAAPIFLHFVRYFYGA